MSNFVNDKTSLPTNKVDIFTGSPSVNFVSASDWNSVAQACLDLRGQSGYSAVVSGTGSGSEYVDVTLSPAFSAATGAGAYAVSVQLSTTADDITVPAWKITNKTTTGFRIRFSDSFDGEVRWSAK